MSLYHRLIRMVAFILCCRCIKVRVVQFFNCPFWSYSLSSALAFKRALNELVWRASLVVEGTLGLSLSELFLSVAINWRGFDGRAWSGWVEGGGAVSVGYFSWKSGRLEK